MSARPDLTNVFGRLDGARIVGGCDNCNAYQTLMPVTAGLWEIVVHHDMRCPTLVAIESHR